MARATIFGLCLRTAYLALALVMARGVARAQDSAATQSALAQERAIATCGGGTSSSSELT
jgi:hypothetical protein